MGLGGLMTDCERITFRYYFWLLGMGDGGGGGGYFFSKRRHST